MPLIEPHWARGLLLLMLWPGLALIAAMPSQAQPERFACAALVSSKVRQPPYGPVAGQPRCEGFYEKNVSQPFIELLSLTRPAVSDLAVVNDAQLTLRGSAKLDSRLLIQPLRSNPLYRADALLARNAALVWDSSPMLKATGLRLRDLGFLATVGAGEAAGFVPVSLTAIDADSPASGQVVAVLRPSIAVSALAWRAYRLSGPAWPARSWQDLPGTPLFAWERIALPLMMPADGYGLRIDVRALDNQGQTLPLLQFAVVGANDDKP